MAFDVSLLVDYSLSDIRKAAKEAMMQMALGGKTIGEMGRTRSTISFAEAKALYEWADQTINDESADTSGGIALVQYGERTGGGGRSGQWVGR